MANEIYSEEEKKLLLDELRTHNGKIIADNFQSYEDLWPGLFSNRKRKAHSLYLETIKLATENHLDLQIVSIPRRIRKSRHHEKKQKPTKLKDQIAQIIQSEVQAASKRIASSVANLIADVIQENTSFKEELHHLRPYKELVEKNYKKELEFRNGG
jgi:hypothetical protein